MSSSSSLTELDSRAATRVSPFKLARVEKTDAPDGAVRRVGDNWYRYVLDNGRSTITGQRRGSLKDVTAHAHRAAAQINARGMSSTSVWAPRGKK